MTDLGHAALGAWSGGRFLHYGVTLDDDRLVALLRPDDEIRTVVTADVYGEGEADRLVGRAIDGLERKLLHAERRVRIHEHRALRGPLVLRELLAGNYTKYSPGWKALAQDLFL